MARPAKPPDPQSNTHDPVPPALRYTPTVLRLDQVDAQTMRHIYCHRDGPSMAWNDDKDATPDNLKSLGESLLSEGQVVPIEFYRDGERNILVRGYRLIEAIQQIIARALDPDRFHPAMEIKAVEIAGGAEVDYLVRAVASNEVRCALSPEAQYKVAAMLLDRGVNATRGSRALGISPTLFGRYIRRHNNPWMLEHVRLKHLGLSYADDLLEAAGNVNKVPQLKEELEAFCGKIQAHIDTLRDRAEATKQKWDEEKQGIVSAYIKKKTIDKWCEAFEEGEKYTPTPVLKPPGWTFTCEVDPKDGKLKIAGLNGLALSQKPYSDLGLIAGRLHLVATQVKSIWLAAKAKQEVAGSNGDADKALLAFYHASGATDLEFDLATRLKAETGEDDPAHGTRTPREVTTHVDTQIQVDQPDEFDPAIDGGP